MPQPERETKSFTISVKDAEKGTVEAVFSTFNVVDHDGDITLPGAFEDGAKAAISDYGHSVWMGGKPVGKGTIRVENDRAILEGKFFLSTGHGREAFETVKAMGDMQEWSYGFDVLDHETPNEEQKKQGARRVLKKLKTYEVSPVFRGAGINTQTLAVKEQKGLAEAREPAFAVGAQVRSLVDHMPGMSSMVGTVAEAHAGDPPYYAVNFDPPMGEGNPHKWLSEDEVEAAPVATDMEPMKALTDEEKQARYEITAKGRRELARFIQTMTRLAS